jgi:hypothetical protein
MSLNLNEPTGFPVGSCRFHTVVPYRLPGLDSNGRIDFLGSI